ncbi:hypothetical protein K5Q02_15090 [Pseudomonas sp. MM211]|uniref:lipopolysaccharide biosynthesis protein n=1 Tax=Pseudomonas sp. MM211 TaxID=2866808 RepID=UPI001CED8AAF|nr:hypothetical protein [Pseudomonas sp. MM211]UCJ15186.1 hypothetical protein K5Q02_15090 [Pseudomonas sp. MM211]
MSTFWKNVSSVFTGSLLAQSIPIIGSLAITRIFAPSEFGEFSTWLALVSFLAVAVTLRLETVLAIVEDGRARTHAVCIVLVTTLLVAFILAMLLYILSSFSIPRNYLPEQAILMVLIVPAALLVALNQVWQTWAAVDGAYGKLNVMRLAQALVIVLIQIGAGLKYPTAASLVLGFVLASGISFVSAVMLMPRFFHNFFFILMGFGIFLLDIKSFLCMHCLLIPSIQLWRNYRCLLCITDLVAKQRGIWH